MNEQDFYYNSFRGRLLGSKAREHLILEEMQLLKEKDFFLDAGCAQGHYLKKALEKTGNVFGLDFDSQKLGQIPALEKFCLVNASAEEMPFAENCFDFVLCSEVLEHLPDWKKGLSELKRICRGKIVLTIPLEKSWFWRAFSKFAGMATRGHLHKLESKDIMQEMKGWVLEKNFLIHSPSRRINRLLAERVGEKKAMYAFLVFRKGGFNGKND